MPSLKGDLTDTKPSLTDRLIHLTYTYLPGASAPQPNAPTTPPNTPDAESGNPEAGRFTFTDVVVVTAPTPSRLAIVIQLIVVILFTVALFLVLQSDGYTPLTENGRPRTYDINAKLFDPSRCGPDAVDCLTTSTDWFGAHCPRTGGGIVRGTDHYTADSTLCAAAVHAGVISNKGGCFEVRFTGPRDNFTGSYQNGVTSKPFGWFPQSIQFRSVDQPTGCSDTRWLSDVVVALGFFSLVILWRVDSRWLDHIAAQWGFYYAGLTSAKASGNFWPVMNSLCKREFTLIPMCFFLFHVFGGYQTGFCPDPKRRPFDALIFFCTVYWAFIHLRDYEDSGINLSFTPTGLASLTPSSKAILILIGVVAVPLTFLQVRAICRAGLFARYLFGFALLIGYLLIIQLAAEEGMFSFHLHHFFIGLLLCVCGKGGEGRHSAFIQAIGLALFVEGLAVYDTAPFFDQNRAPAVGYESPPAPSLTPIITRAELVNDRVVLEWTTQSCNTTFLGGEAYVARNGIRCPGLFKGLFNESIVELSVYYTVELAGRQSVRIPIPLPEPAPTELDACGRADWIIEKTKLDGWWRN